MNGSPVTWSCLRRWHPRRGRLHSRERQIRPPDSDKGRPRSRYVAGAIMWDRKGPPAGPFYPTSSERSRRSSWGPPRRGTGAHALPGWLAEFGEQVLGPVPDRVAADMVGPGGLAEGGEHLPAGGEAGVALDAGE